MLLSSPQVETDLSRWKVIIGGAALPKVLAKQARDRGVDIRCLRMSETCPILVFAQLKTAHAGLGRGTATRDSLQDRSADSGMVDLRIVDEEMNDLPQDGVTQVKWWCAHRG